MELPNYFVSLRSLHSQFYQGGQGNPKGFLKGVMDILFDAACANRRLVAPLKHVAATFFNVNDFDQWLEAFIPTTPVHSPAEKVSLAGGAASIAMLEDKLDLALRLWSPVLTTARHDSEAGLVGISTEDYARYDRNTFHTVPARELSHFAIGGVFHKRRGNLLNVLDLCCGTGLAASYIHRQCQSLVGIDIELSGLNASGRNKFYTEVVEGDVQAITPGLPGPFDLILMNGAAYFFSDLRWLMAMASRMQPGGEICFNTFLCPDDHETMVTAAGTIRHCHSIPYLKRIAEEAGLRLVEWVPANLYCYPVYLVRIEKPM